MLAPDGGMFTTGGLSAKVIADTTAATKQLLDAAKSGGFKITEAGVKPMRDALTEVRTKLESLTDVSFVLAQAPQLGDHPYGHTVAAHDQKGASQDANSAGQVLEQLRQMVIEADEALARAAGVYKENESQAAEAMKGF
ncbi:MAG: hypothetical protein QOI21_1621 [Actinomycetota bacterium]|jgi:hypothetical protein|nr:hypothetical protein [Actinomycetota bacterium]